MKKILAFLLCLCCFSCTERIQTPEELFDTQSSGVVLIANHYYYQITLSSGEKFYFTGFDSDGNLENFTDEIEEVTQSPAIATGTGFFIDSKGTIMTNRHVAQPTIDTYDAKRAYKRLIDGMVLYLEAYQEELSERYDSLAEEKSEYIYYYNAFDGMTNYQDKIQALTAEQEDLRGIYQQVGAKIEEIQAMSDISELKIQTVSKLGIAYNETHVTSFDDFFKNNSCVVTKVSDKEDVDLALIQLKNKTTPSTIFVFDVKGQREGKNFLDAFTNNADDNTLKIDQQLYMIGYNAGLTLGNTQQGIKAQMTGGRLTQLPDGQRLLYSIPTMQGSSGSPVVDDKGNFVGVNFAKLKGTDNFNFGIPKEKVINFLER